MVILQFPMSVYLRLNQVSIYMDIHPYTSIDLKSAARKSRKTQPMRIFAPTSMALFNKKPKTLEFCWADLFVWGKSQSCRVAKFQRFGSHEITNELRSWCQLVSAGGRPLGSRSSGFSANKLNAVVGELCSGAGLGKRIVGLNQTSKSQIQDP